MFAHHLPAVHVGGDRSGLRHRVHPRPGRQHEPRQLLRRPDARHHAHHAADLVRGRHRLRRPRRPGDVRRRADGQHAERPAHAAGRASTVRPVDRAAPTTRRPHRRATSQGQQTITRGPVAALASIKHLGTNGGGWFNANSAHPFENPNPITNILENILMALLPMAHHLHARHHDQPHEAGLDLLLGHGRLLPGLPGRSPTSARRRATRC